jgi:hypothetical protein
MPSVGSYFASSKQARKAILLDGICVAVGSVIPKSLYIITIRVRAPYEYGRNERTPVRGAIAGNNGDADQVSLPQGVDANMNCARNVAKNRRRGSEGGRSPSPERLFGGHFCQD